MFFSEISVILSIRRNTPTLMGFPMKNTTLNLKSIIYNKGAEIATRVAILWGLRVVSGVLVILG